MKVHKRPYFVVQMMKSRNCQVNILSIAKKLAFSRGCKIQESKNCFGMYQRNWFIWNKAQKFLNKIQPSFLSSCLKFKTLKIFEFRCPKVANLEFEWSIGQHLTNFHFMRKYSPLLDDLKSTFLQLQVTLYFGAKIQICCQVIRNNALFL